MGITPSARSSRRPRRCGQRCRGVRRPRPPGKGVRHPAVRAPSPPTLAARATSNRSPSSSSRTRPDGVELAWHRVGLDAAMAEGLPFFIRWHVDDVDHPGRALVDHGCAAVGIDWIAIGGDEDQLASWLGHHELSSSAHRWRAWAAPGGRRHR
ncbi:MAG: VOC family protein [Acidimicrobiales bacterium]